MELKYFDIHNNNSFVLMKDDTTFKDAVAKFQIPYLDHLALPETMQYGVELEFNGAYLTEVEEALEYYQKCNNLTLTHDWYVTDDMTVSERIMNHYIGGEVDSPILKDTKKDWQELEEVCNLIQDLDGYVSENCGLHAHFDFQKIHMTKTQIWNLMVLWYQYEEIIYTFATGEDEMLRDGARILAKSIRPLINQLLKEEELDLLFDPFGPVMQDNYGLNIERFVHCVAGFPYDYSTLEFRVGNGTLNPVVIQNYIRLYANLLKTSFNITKPLKIKELKEEPYYEYIPENIEEAYQFADTVFDNNFDKLCFIKQYKKRD